MWQDWLATSWTEVALIGISAVGIFLAVVAYVRLAGLRSFSKMSAFDFAMTLAVGSVMAATAASPSVSLANGVIAIGALFVIQTVLAVGRRHRGWGRLLDNSPVLLMDGRRLLHDNMDKARVTEEDIRAKLREANVLDLGQVRAVVLETTGDISVLHGEGPFDHDEILRGVGGSGRLDPDDGDEPSHWPTATRRP